jgi:phosphatidate phosphatase APP1
MSLWKRFWLGLLRAILLFFAHVKYYFKLFLSLFGQAPIAILAYRGYGSRQHVFLQGRVLKKKIVHTTPEDTLWQNLVNNYKRFGSAEIRGAQLEITVGDNMFQVQSDREGYFYLDEVLKIPLPDDGEEWEKATIRVLRTRRREVNLITTGEMLTPKQAEFGVISDIDDTILITEVTSLLKLKMIYLTFFKSAAKRQTFHEVEAFFQGLRRGKTGEGVNPIFYVSKSPWNLYDFLEDFIKINDLPKGPLLLRDMGLLPSRFLFEQLEKQYRGHKIASAVRILRMYPQLPFILIGDSGEKDTDIYLTIAKAFPTQVKAIYIHDVKDPRRARRILKMMQESGVAHIKLVNTYRDAAQDAARQGFLNMEVFEKYGKK